MTKLMDYNSLGWRFAISVILGLVSYGVLYPLQLPARVAPVISFLVAVLALLFAFLHAITRGIERLWSATSAQSNWLGIVSDYARVGEFDVKNLLDKVATIRGKVILRPDSAYNSIALEVFRSVTYKLSELANDEYETVGQAAFDTYIRFLDGLKQSDRYLATSVIAIPGFWQDEQEGPRVFEANKRAVERGVRMDRIFVLQNLDELAQNANDARTRKEIIRHKSIGVNIGIVLAASLPVECKRDFGVFNDVVAGRFELGPVHALIGIRYYFAEREVENFIRLYEMIRNYNIVDKPGYGSLEELLGGGAPGAGVQ